MSDIKQAISESVDWEEIIGKLMKKEKTPLAIEYVTEIQYIELTPKKDVIYRIVTEKQLLELQDTTQERLIQCNKKCRTFWQLFRNELVEMIVPNCILKKINNK